MARGISVIAIDGPVAAGKTVVGRELAQRLGFASLDTGIMYRAITWLALHTGISVENETSLGELARNNPVNLEGDEGNRVSVAGHSLGPELRESPWTETFRWFPRSRRCAGSWWTNNGRSLPKGRSS